MVVFHLSNSMVWILTRKSSVIQINHLASFHIPFKKNLIPTRQKKHSCENYPRINTFQSEDKLIGHSPQSGLQAFPPVLGFGSHLRADPPQGMDMKYGRGHYDQLGGTVGLYSSSSSWAGHTGQSLQAHWPPTARGRVENSTFPDTALPISRPKTTVNSTGFCLMSLMTFTCILHLSCLFATPEPSYYYVTWLKLGFSLVGWCKCLNRNGTYQGFSS